MFAMPAPSLSSKPLVAALPRGRKLPALLGRQARAHFIQSAAQRAIVNRIPDSYDHAAQQGWVKRVFCFNLLSRQPRQRRCHFFLLCPGQFDRRRNFRFGNSLPMPNNFMKRGDNFRNQLRTPVVGDHKEKISDNLARAQPRHDFLDDRMLRFNAHRRACQKRAQLGGFGVRCTKIMKLLGSRLGRTLRQRDIRHRVRVLQARRLQFGLPSRLFTKLLMSDSCAFGVSCLASSDSAPSTARFAASAFNSRRAARSAASISAFAAAAIFCISLCVAALRRSTSAADSRSANARSSATSFCRFASLVSASRSCASAAALAPVAFVIAELTASALFLNTGGSNLPKTQTITPATMAKLIHLKISVARSVATFPPSSAACAPTTTKSNTNRALTTKSRERFRVIEPLSRERPDAAELAGRGAQFRRKVVQRWLQSRREQPQVPRPHALSRHSLRPRLSRARP